MSSLFTFRKASTMNLDERNGDDIESGERAARAAKRAAVAVFRPTVSTASKVQPIRIRDVAPHPDAPLSRVFQSLGRLSEDFYTTHL